jgi:hypothetical protein
MQVRQTQEIRQTPQQPLTNFPKPDNVMSIALVYNCADHQTLDY